MTQLALVLLFFSGVSAAVGQANARHTAHAASSGCRPITADMLSKPLLLPEGCYTVSRFVNVGHPLVVSPGSTLIFGGGAELSIQSNASFEAIGTAEKPIILRGRDDTAGSWSGLSIASRSSHNRLSYVTVEDAGVKGSDTAAILLAPGAQLGVDHTTVKRSLGTGIQVMDGAAFSLFEANHFVENDTPLRIKASDVAKMDPATTFADNKNNAVIVPFGEGEVNEDVLWRKLAVPYRFEASVEVKARLTIEAGTELQFHENLLLKVDQNGSLTAIGIETDPIVFTATDETPGYWSGIFFESKSSSNVLRHVDVRFSGSKSGAAGGGIGITHHASATVQSSVISSCPVGIYVASEGTLNPDAASSNRFQDVQQPIFVEP